MIMENQEFIAFEMAMLLKENRKLRDEVVAIRNAYTDIKEECNDLRNEISKLKEKRKEEKVKKVYDLYDAPFDVDEGSHIVITDVQAKTTRIPKGFVLSVSRISKNDEGAIFVYGKYQSVIKGWENGRYVPKTIMRNTKINNKTHNWKLTEAELSTVDESINYNKPEFKNLIEV